MNHEKDRAGPPAGKPSELDALQPHERDERSAPIDENAQHRQNRETIQRAHDDAESDITDTERIGVPNDVPSSRTQGKP